MYKAISERIKQGYKTTDFPKNNPELSNRYKGVPAIKCSKTECSECIKICPVKEIFFDKEFKIDLSKCIFCDECIRKCHDNNISFSNDFRMAVSEKKDLIVSDKPLQLANDTKNKIYKIFKRSLKLRVVSAGGCNACEADINVLSTITYDLGRFGVQIVASPRHADGLIVTGPVTINMESALKKTYEAVPDPKIVIAVGACALSGGIFQNHSEQKNGVDTILPVNLFIPGCPPNPYTILDGILRLLKFKSHLGG